MGIYVAWVPLSRHQILSSNLSACQSRLSGGLTVKLAVMPFDWQTFGSMKILSHSCAFYYWWLGSCNEEKKGSICRRTNQIFYQPVFHLAWFAILCAMTDLLKSDFRDSLGFWKTWRLHLPALLSWIYFAIITIIKVKTTLWKIDSISASCHKVSICLRGARGLITIKEIW